MFNPLNPSTLENRQDYASSPILATVSPRTHLDPRPYLNPQQQALHSKPIQTHLNLKPLNL